MIRLVLIALAFASVLFLSAAAQCAGLEERLTGVHPLTLQWLDNTNQGKTGTVTIYRRDGQIFAEGKQEEESQGELNWMELFGTVTIINDRELELDGHITTRISFINGGKTNVRKGQFRFKAWGKRQFWRMQNNRLQPDNGFEVTDYIDIHFRKL